MTDYNKISNFKEGMTVSDLALLLDANSPTQLPIIEKTLKLVRILRFMLPLHLLESLSMDKTPRIMLLLPAVKQLKI